MFILFFHQFQWDTDKFQKHFLGIKKKKNHFCILTWFSNKSGAHYKTFSCIPLIQAISHLAEVRKNPYENEDGRAGTVFTGLFFLFPKLAQHQWDGLCSLIYLPILSSATFWFPFTSMPFLPVSNTNLPQLWWIKSFFAINLINSNFQKNRNSYHLCGIYIFHNKM